MEEADAVAGFVDLLAAGATALDELFLQVFLAHPGERHAVGQDLPAASGGMRGFVVSGVHFLWSARGPRW